MLQNLLLGSVLVAFSVLVHTIGLILVAAAMPGMARGLRLHNHDAGRTLMMAVTVLGILCLLTFEVWGWAIAYFALRATANFADALYLSTAMFSTVGYAGISVDPEWRLLTALEGINGFLLIGWSTAFLVRASARHGPFKAEHF